MLHANANIANLMVEHDDKIGKECKAKVNKYEPTHKYEQV